MRITNTLIKGKLKTVCELTEHKWKTIELGFLAKKFTSVEKIEKCERCGERRIEYES